MTDKNTLSIDEQFQKVGQALIKLEGQDPTNDSFLQLLYYLVMAIHNADNNCELKEPKQCFEILSAVFKAGQNYLEAKHEQDMNFRADKEILIPAASFKAVAAMENTIDLINPEEGHISHYKDVLNRCGVTLSGPHAFL